MNANEIVSRIIQGSQNLNIMRVRIHLLVKTIKPFIKFELHEKIYYTIPTNTGGYWEVSKNESERDVVITFWREKDKRLLYNGKSGSGIQMEFVLLIYDSLEALVAVLFEKMKYLESDCAPLLDAYKVQLD